MSRNKQRRRVFENSHGWDGRCLALGIDERGGGYELKVYGPPVVFEILVETERASGTYGWGGVQESLEINHGITTSSNFLMIF